MTSSNPKLNKASRGVVYAASGAKCLDECSVSISTLTKCSPSLPFVVFTDEPESWVGRSWSAENVLPLPSMSTPIGQEWTALTGVKIDAIASSPFDKTLFIDTDTAVLGDVEPLFGLLERFEIAAGECSHWFGQCTAETLLKSRIPLTFPEFNTGVILVDSASPKTKVFMAAWKEIFQRDLLQDATRSSDQQAFREAVWTSNISVLTLKQNFNYMGQQGVHMPVVIAHKILNKNMNFPKASPENLVSAISSIEEDSAWSLLSKLGRSGGTLEDFERLKQFDHFGAARRLIYFDELGRKAYGEAVARTPNTSQPAHVISLYRKLRRKFSATPIRWRRRLVWTLMAWNIRLGRWTPFRMD
jgi:hypothetical protein